MNRPQRIVVILYCLLVVYCCTWVPWHIVPPSNPPIRAGYGWLWSGPPSTQVLPNIYSDVSPGENVIGASDIPPKYTSPDFPIIGLRLLAAAALCGAAWCVVGFLGANPSPPAQQH